MKIYVIVDHNGYNKTILNVVEKWREQGHQVKVDMYYDVEKMMWCDVIFGDYIQGGIVHAVKDENNKKPMVIRGIDIDLYFGHYMGLDWDKCKAVLFINDYMREYIVDKYKAAKGVEPKCQIETVHLGIDLAKFTYKEGKKGKNIGWLNRFWTGKGIELMLQIVYKMVKYDPEYKFELVGPCNEHWVEKYISEFLKRNGLSENVKKLSSVPDVNVWMENMDYMLSTSMKECMSLPIAEAMAKGIKPVIHNWWGADNLYPGDLVFQTAEQACDIIMEDKYDSHFYRKYIEDNYTLDKEVNKLNEILGL